MTLALTDEHRELGATARRWIESHAPVATDLVAVVLPEGASRRSVRHRVRPVEREEPSSTVGGRVDDHLVAGALPGAGLDDGVRHAGLVHGTQQMLGVVADVLAECLGEQLGLRGAGRTPIAWAVDACGQLGNGRARAEVAVTVDQILRRPPGLSYAGLGQLNGVHRMLLLRTSVVVVVGSRRRR